MACSIEVSYGVEKHSKVLRWCADRYFPIVVGLDASQCDMELSFMSLSRSASGHGCLGRLRIRAVLSWSGICHGYGDDHPPDDDVEHHFR